jgi:hypothetical protein
MRVICGLARQHSNESLPTAVARPSAYLPTFFFLCWCCVNRLFLRALILLLVGRWWWWWVTSKQ